MIHFLFFGDFGQFLQKWNTRCFCPLLLKFHHLDLGNVGFGWTPDLKKWCLWTLWAPLGLSELHFGEVVGFLRGKKWLSHPPVAQPQMTIAGKVQPWMSRCIFFLFKNGDFPASHVSELGCVLFYKSAIFKGSNEHALPGNRLNQDEPLTILTKKPAA